MKLRQSNLDKLESRLFDVLIVGGGINGAVSAAALSAQGVSVAIVERGDFASFTSQESSNLVWGGVKYLESGELGLVFKLCGSRNDLLRAYPSSVREIRMFACVERGLGFLRRPFVLFLGSLLYWAIGRFYTRAPRLLSPATIERDEPKVAALGAGGVEYSEGHLVDSDARFVFNFVRRALDHGAIAVNYVESLGSKRSEAGEWVTCVRDARSGREFSVRSRVLINAAGPFVDERNALDGRRTHHRHIFSKGVHLMVPRITTNHRILTFFADDGRLFFVIPMGPVSSIGTTDTKVDTLPPRIEESDRDFILNNVNKRLRLSKPLTRDDVIAERCGVRPLAVDGNGAETGDWIALSRKHVIEVDRAAKHISIFGGKLTDCLNVGDEITDELRSLGIPIPYRGRRWYGEPPAVVRDAFFHQAKLLRLDEMTAKESTEPLSARLWRRYAEWALTLLEEIRRDARMAEVLIAGTEYIRCELHHAAKHEMVEKLADFLRRRSKIALIARPPQIRAAPGLTEACEILFGDQALAKLEEYFESAQASGVRSESLRRDCAQHASPEAHRC